MQRAAFTGLALTILGAASAGSAAPLTQPLVVSGYEVVVGQVADNAPGPTTQDCVPERECHLLLSVRYEDRLEPLGIVLRIRQHIAEIAFQHPTRRVGVQQSGLSWITMIDGSRDATIAVNEYPPDAAIGGSMAVPPVVRHPIGTFTTLRLAIRSRP
jgi:hypothetical protein